MKATHTKAHHCEISETENGEKIIKAFRRKTKNKNQITQDETRMASVVVVEQSLQNSEEIINYNLEFYTMVIILIARIE